MHNAYTSSQSLDICQSIRACTSRPTTGRSGHHARMLISVVYPTCKDTLGGSSRRAAAMVHASSDSDGSGQPAMAVLGLARKFWMITSCIYVSMCNLKGTSE